MTQTAYAPRHSDIDPVEATHYAYDPSDPHDALELLEVVEVLRGMPLDPNALGDGGPSDWTLSILFALAGRGDSDAHAYIAPRLEAAALQLLAEVGYPGDAFQGA